MISTSLIADPFDRFEVSVVLCLVKLPNSLPQRRSKRETEDLVFELSEISFSLTSLDGKFNILETSNSTDGHAIKGLANSNGLWMYQRKSTVGFHRFTRVTVGWRQKSGTHGFGIEEVWDTIPRLDSSEILRSSSTIPTLLIYLTGF